MSKIELTPNNLRIGNLLNDRYRNIAIVEQITKDGYKAYSGAITGLPLSPIPLTEEWLELKFKFSQSFTTDPQGPDATSKYWIGNFVLFFDPNIGVSFWHNDECTIIECVHQLQNIYHALIGEELEIKN